ncbi:MAG TPA: hypothetical protein PLE10_05565 [Brevefilum sp.]|nr:hypothetical protein [Brevefilum sp.]HOR19281.1 hypothetical protein [Brevefilum sp.]HPL69886.1 hypothetical protein [Brevefilum sp.]
MRISPGVTAGRRTGDSQSVRDEKAINLINVVGAANQNRQGLEKLLYYRQSTR